MDVFEVADMTIEAVCTALIDKFEGMYVDEDDITFDEVGAVNQGWNDALTEVIIHLNKVKEGRD